MAPGMYLVRTDGPMPGECFWQKLEPGRSTNYWERRILEPRRSRQLERLSLMVILDFASTHMVMFIGRTGLHFSPLPHATSGKTQEETCSIGRLVLASRRSRSRRLPLVRPRRQRISRSLQSMSKGALLFCL